jgi:transcription elongation factor SPT5
VETELSNMMVFEKDDQGEIELRQAMQPTIKDPLLWQVKVQAGKEQMAVLQILTKCAAYINANKPQGVISAVSYDHIKGSIFVESFKEQDALSMLVGI